MYNATLETLVPIDQKLAQSIFINFLLKQIFHQRNRLPQIGIGTKHLVPNPDYKLDISDVCGLALF